MSIYDAGSASLSADGTVTGVGTTWRQPLTLIRVGATMIFNTTPASIVTIAEIISDTEIRVFNDKGFTAPAGTQYSILAHDGITVQGLAQDVAETLRYYQSRETEIAAAVDAFNQFDADAFQQNVTNVNNQSQQVSIDAAQVAQDRDSAQNSASSASDSESIATQAAIDAQSAASSVIDVVNLGSDIQNQDYKSKSLKAAFSNRVYCFDSVSEMISADFTGSELPARVKTLSNIHGIKVDDEWVVSSSMDSSTYSVEVSGAFANLALKNKMSYASFGFGGTNSQQNTDAINLANSIARANSFMSCLEFPSGTFNVVSVDLDVDRRGFTFSGAGRDASILIANTSGYSLHHVGIDPRDRTRDRLHWHQIVEKFTVNGNIENRGAISATRAIYTAPYAKISNKSINHLVSNYDLLHLATYLDAHSQGSTSGSLYTKYGVRARNNSQKITGYIGNTSSGSTISVQGMSTRLSSAVSIGDTTCTVYDASGFDQFFEIAFTNSTGGVETRRVVSISSNVITLDSPMTSAFGVNSKVEVPIIATAISDATIEVGELRIGDSQATKISGCYSEEVRFYISNRVRGLEISGCSTAERSPAMQIEASKDSVISIHDNDCTFSISLNIIDRTGVTGGQRIDLSSAPKVEIKQSTRVSNSILVNGLYGFDELSIRKTFDSSTSDYAFSELVFSGFNVVSAPGGVSSEVIQFYQDSSSAFDGYCFDINANCRSTNSSASAVCGVIKRSGFSNARAQNSTIRTISLFELFDQDRGYDIFIGGGSNRGSISIKSHPTSSIKCSISGTVTSML